MLQLIRAPGAYSLLLKASPPLTAVPGVARKARGDLYLRGQESARTDDRQEASSAQCPRTQYQAPMCTHGTEKASGMAGPSSGHSLSSSYLSPLCLDSSHGLLSVTHSTKCLSVACQGPGTGLSVFSLLTHFILTGTPLNREASRGSQSQTIHPSHTAHAWMRPRLLTDLLQSSQHSLSSSDLPLLSPRTTHPETSVTPHSPCRTSSCLRPMPPSSFRCSSLSPLKLQPKLHFHQAPASFSPLPQPEYPNLTHPGLRCYLFFEDFPDIPSPPCSDPSGPLCPACLERSFLTHLCFRTQNLRASNCQAHTTPPPFAPGFNRLSPLHQPAPHTRSKNPAEESETEAGQSLIFQAQRPRSYRSKWQGWGSNSRTHTPDYHRHGSHFTSGSRASNLQSTQWRAIRPVPMSLWLRAGRALCLPCPHLSWHSGCSLFSPSTSLPVTSKYAPHVAQAHTTQLSCPHFQTASQHVQSQTHLPSQTCSSHNPPRLSRATPLLQLLRPNRLESRPCPSDAALTCTLVTLSHFPLTTLACFLNETPPRKPKGCCSFPFKFLTTQL